MSEETSYGMDYEQVRAVLVRAVRKVCPPWLSADADDLVQTAVLRVMSLDERSEGNRQLEASYLYRVGHSVVIDEIRKRRRRQESQPDTEDESSEPMSPQPQPDQEAESAQGGLAIRDCLSQLKEERRRAVTLYLAGNTVPEAGRLLGWTTKKTENLVYRGLAGLRQCLMAKGVRP